MNQKTFEDENLIKNSSKIALLFMDEFYEKIYEVAEREKLSGEVMIGFIINTAAFTFVKILHSLQVALNENEKIITLKKLVEVAHEKMNQHAENIEILVKENPIPVQQ